MRDRDDVFAGLSRSRFRSRFALGPKEREYYRKRGLERIVQEGWGFIENRLAPAASSNDGKQTPTKGHPIFVAQHATATCCRRCLNKWHNIRPGQSLEARQIEYVLDVLATWLKDQRVKPLTPTLPGLNADTEPL